MVVARVASLIPHPNPSPEGEGLGRRLDTCTFPLCRPSDKVVQGPALVVARAEIAPDKLADAATPLKEMAGA